MTVAGQTREAPTMRQKQRLLYRNKRVEDPKKGRVERLDLFLLLRSTR